MPLPVQLPYSEDTFALAGRLLRRPWAQWLDSAGRGRYDILVAAPVATLVSRGQETVICRGGQCEVSQEPPFELLRRELAHHQPLVDVPPFAGGAVGYFGYDLARRYMSLPAQALDDSALPEMAVGIYDWAIVVDHQARRCWLSGDAAAEETLHRLIAAAPSGDTFRVSGPVTSNIDRGGYTAAIARIQAYLREGDCYQVNFAQRFCAPAQGDPLTLYRKLRASNPAPYSAYLSFPFGQILSASPERFLQVRKGQVETKPIKGTRPRLSRPAEDVAQAEALRHSAKDRAENLMIVDLLRNDLGKSCRPGSVQVPKLFEVESFATVHHLVSTVTGELAPGRDAVALLEGCFPGGSITGAPKQRAMEIIEELEPNRRGVYCGAIGYIGFDGDMDTNIAIRTLVYDGRRICAAAGGGIVMDSNAADEYAESLAKAAALLELMEQHRVS